MAPPRPARRDAPVSAVERAAWAAGRAVVGVDEVGRGAWAGPVTVGAVVLDPAAPPAGVRDSKTLSPAARAAAAAAVHASARTALGHADSGEVDDLGLAAALRLAVRRAVAAVLDLPGAAGVAGDPVVLIDGPQDLLGRDDLETVTLVRGDAAALSIAAASVVAKVARDAAMVAVDPDHPAYGFARNKGYPSPEHIAALAAHGPCALHRVSWAPLRALAQGQLPGTTD